MLHSQKNLPRQPITGHRLLFAAYLSYLKVDLRPKKLFAFGYRGCLLRSYLSCPWRPIVFTVVGVRRRLASGKFGTRLVTVFQKVLRNRVILLMMRPFRQIGRSVRRKSRFSAVGRGRVVLFGVSSSRTPWEFIIVLVLMQQIGVFPVLRRIRLRRVVVLELLQNLNIPAKLLLLAIVLMLLRMVIPVLFSLLIAVKLLKLLLMVIRLILERVIVVRVGRSSIKFRQSRLLMSVLLILLKLLLILVTRVLSVKNLRVPVVLLILLVHCRLMIVVLILLIKFLAVSLILLSVARLLMKLLFARQWAILGVAWGRANLIVMMNRWSGSRIILGSRTLRVIGVLILNGMHRGRLIIFVLLMKSSVPRTAQIWRGSSPTLVRV